MCLVKGLECLTRLIGTQSRLVPAVSIGNGQVGAGLLVSDVG